MTEDEWLTCDDPKPMLELVESASARKLRLLACGIVRAVPIFRDDLRTMWELIETYPWFAQTAWRYYVDNRWRPVQDDELVTTNCHEAIETAERYADDHTLVAELATAKFATFSARWHAESDVLGPVRIPGAESRYRLTQQIEHATQADEDLRAWMVPPLDYFDLPLSDSLLSTIAALLRDIFGNPFRPVSVDPAWLTSTVVTLATGIYEQRAFDRMPILADALQDAGCENADILNHCRAVGPHVRGCWVVDLLLGKS